jgi:hypothetical protein
MTVAQSVQRLVTGWTVRNRILVGAKFSALVQAGYEVHRASYTMGTESFPGVKRPRRGVDHPSLSSVEAKERVELHLYPSFGPSWTVLGWTLRLPLPLPLPYDNLYSSINPLNPELNLICELLALLAHHFLHVSRIRDKSLTFRLLMSYIYGAPILDVSRSLITRPEESYRLCCVVVCDLETSRIYTPYIYEISTLRVKHRLNSS